MKNILKSYLLILTWIFFLVSKLSAQQPNLQFQHLGVADGLSQNTVTAIFQDRKGLIWFGTQDGLNYYDGYTFTVYKNIPFDSTSLSSNWIQSITQDNHGDFWIGTQTGGLFRLNRDLNVFTNFKHERGNPNSLSSNRVWAVLKDKAGNIWSGTSGGLDFYDLKRGEFTHFVHIENDSTSLSNNAVNALYQEKNGTLWVGTFGGGLDRLTFNKNTNLPGPKSRFKHFIFTKDGRFDQELNLIKAVVPEDDFLWLATYGGIVKFNKADGSYSVYSIIESEKAFRPNANAVLSLCIDNEGEIWAGTHDYGLLKFNRDNGQFIQYGHNPYDPKSISDNWVNSILQDRSGILWIGTGAGINKLIPRNQQFSHFQNNPLDHNSIGVGEVTSICTDHNGGIWIATWGSGLNKFDVDKKSFKNYSLSGIGSGERPDNIIWCIFEDNEKRLWLGTYNGISVFDESSGKVIQKSYMLQGLSHNNVSVIYEDSRDNLWIGTWGGGLNKLDKKLNNFVAYKNNPGDERSISDNYISAVLEDKRHNLWIGTNSGGLNKYNYGENNFTAIRYRPNNLNSLSSNSIKTLFEDKAGNVWIGTWGGGVNKMIKDGSKFIHYTEEDGLSNNVVYAVLEDNKGNLWMSTNKGISRFNEYKKQFINFSAEDGPGIDQYSSGHLKLNNGAMIFGGSNGITYFNPDNIRANRNQPGVMITSFKVFNQKVHPYKPISEQHEISLDYNRNSFSIEFAALDFSNPSKNRYAHMLEGFDKNWIYTGNQRTAAYTNLSPGTYLFRVQAANNDNVWSSGSAYLTIRIIPPFWKTWWFNALTLLFFVGLVFLTFKIRIRNIERNNRRLEILVKDRTADLEKEISVRKDTEAALRHSQKKLTELNASKDKFFSIISHDLKSPFFSLLGYSSLLDSEFDNLSREEIKTSLGNMTKLVKRLSAMTENLLSWARLQSGRLKFKPDVYCLKELIDDSLNIAELSASIKQVNLRPSCESSLKVYVDKNMINSVIQNLVTNAIKFSQPGSYVSIICSRKDDFAEICVEDHGVGIDKEGMKKIFQIGEHYTTKGTADESGSGLGLILSKELVEKNGGGIRIESEVGNGSRFIFTLPLAKS